MFLQKLFTTIIANKPVLLTSSISLNVAKSKWATVDYSVTACDTVLNETRSYRTVDKKD